ncbi:MAG: hypothetical protein WHS89_02310 [Acidimicrobiales bacterium]
MAHASNTELLVLLGLRLRGFAEPDALAELVGVPVDLVVKQLEAFEAASLVRHRAGSVSGWTLTAAGRAEGERLLGAELDATGTRDAVERCYRTFLRYNPALLDLCTRWQVRDRGDGVVINDHSDPDYDDVLVRELVALDAGVGPVCEELARALDRFCSYRPRLAHALDRVRRGEVDWFTKPTIGSYHTVWFELHENLLATLGIERGSES